MRAAGLAGRRSGATATHCQTGDKGSRAAGDLAPLLKRSCMSTSNLLGPGASKIYSGRRSSIEATEATEATDIGRAHHVSGSRASSPSGRSPPRSRRNSVTWANFDERFGAAPAEETTAANIMLAGIAWEAPPLGRTSCAGDVNCPEVATPSISQVVATRSSGIAAFGTHSTSIAQESATTGCARARPAAILVSAGDKENHDPFPVKEACFPPPRPATAVPDATSSTTAPSGSTLPLLDNELKPVDQATGNLGAMNSCVEKPAGGLAWDPLGVMTGDNKGKSRLLQSLQLSLQQRVLAYAFRSALISALGAAPEAAAKVNSALELGAAASPSGGSGGAAAAAALLHLEGALSSLSAGLGPAFLHHASLLNSGDGGHLSHFVSLLLVGTAVGAASGSLATRVVDALANGMMPGGGGSADGDDDSSCGDDQKGDILSSAGGTSAGGESGGLLSSLRLSAEEAGAADSPGSPAPIRAYYAMRRAASNVSNSVIFGAVQVAILTVMTSACPALVQAVPDKGALLSEVMAAVAETSTRPMNSGLRKRLVDVIRGALAATNRAEPIALAAPLILATEVAAVMAVEGAFLAFGGDPVSCK